VDGQREFRRVMKRNNCEIPDFIKGRGLNGTELARMGEVGLC